MVFFFVFLGTAFSCLTNLNVTLLNGGKVVDTSYLRAFEI